MWGNHSLRHPFLTWDNALKNDDHHTFIFLTTQQLQLDTRTKIHLDTSPFIHFDDKYFWTEGVYSHDGLPQNALGLREQASWMHPT